MTDRRAQKQHGPIRATRVQVVAILPTRFSAEQTTRARRFAGTGRIATGLPQSR